MFRLIIFIFLFTSCTTVYLSRVRFGIHPDALKYVHKFERLYGKPIPKHIKVDILKMNRPGLGGVCFMDKGVIILNADTWYKRSELEREIIALHEFGHCILRRDHVFYDDKKWRCPPSLLGWMGIPEICYKKHYDYYINELFTGCRKFRVVE